MTVPALTEAELWDIINQQEVELTPAQARLWEAVRIMPEKWQQEPWGAHTGGFWAIAVIGQRVVWYNEIEGGFDLSPFNEYREIALYQCSQFQLSHILQRLLDML